MKVYYAHCKAIYGTPQEERDIKALESMGFEVLNPNTQIIQNKVEEIREEMTQKTRAAKLRYTAIDTAMRVMLDPGVAIMNYFTELVGSCDALAFRSLPDGAIPSGVAKELKHAQSLGYPIIELPSMVSTRIMDVEQTREYLHEIGER
jgi:hypothetical protein